ncbi:hypothetical protein [Streptomyces orinoci]|uniref:Uncharacterized protein n=1 Tax=Streptomyces orinoci TaxID=67339 RepID=A0ABV3K285_STRON|nr:hypothetical protein [Streptomyces orinoci]
MNYLRGFIAWIAFSIAATLDWRLGAVTALITGAALLVKERLDGSLAGSLILEYSSVAFFAALTALALARPHSWLGAHTGAVSSLWLALTAWATLAIGRPFTEEIAKRQTSPRVWNHPLFRRANVVITAAWATAFTLSAAAMTVVYATGLGSVASAVIHLAGFLVPAVFTNRYRARMRRYAVQAGLLGPAEGNAAVSG